MSRSATAALVISLTATGADGSGGPQATEPFPRSAAVKRQGLDEIVVRRRLAAPPHRVFAALTSPELLPQWMDAAGRALVSCEIDLRPGGRYRYVFRSTSGRSFGMSGTYLEVVPNQRLVHTESYDGYDWPPLVTTTRLYASDENTLLEVTIRYPTEAIRDADWPNVEGGSEDGYRRLEQLLAR